MPTRMREDATSGTVVAGCRIVRAIGRGGMGVVYLAEQEALGRRVALKLLSPELAGDPGFRERFQEEARTAASLDHPHVVPIHDAGERDGELYIVMRWLPGGDLRRLLHAGADRGAARRCPHRRLRARLPAVPAADRLGAVPPRQRRGEAVGACQRARPVSARAGADARRTLGRPVRKRAREGARRPLRLRRRPGAGRGRARRRPRAGGRRSQRRDRPRSTGP
ncbi:protein kinase domain-containing protein [Conexibacter arvalis]|uniref:protein kinase domain-containing protein n=1 Tax=Conexibacter arvalis TaxID=912552 RepID=UPI003CCCA5E3